eukprot:1464118-Amphidinium_carterae.1
MAAPFYHVASCSVQNILSLRAGVVLGFKHQTLEEQQSYSEMISEVFSRVRILKRNRRFCFDVCSSQVRSSWGSGGAPPCASKGRQNLLCK